jgi:hypothetical protein
MASSLFGPGTRNGRSAHDIKAAQDKARAADELRERAAAAVRGRRSIGGKR